MSIHFPLTHARDSRMAAFENITSIFDALPADDAHAVFARLAQTRTATHQLEQEFGVPCETILSSIERSSALTKRGILGVIAEAVFSSEIVSSLDGWNDVTTPGDFAYDFALADAHGVVRLQLKRQRRVENAAMMSPSGAMGAVETQRMRGGTTSQGEPTRPYRFGEFDILAVCAQPTTGRWTDFFYTVQRWLIPHRRNDAYLRAMQYFPLVSNLDWTTDYNQCVRWLRSGATKRIADESAGRGRANIGQPCLF